jgi:hypothetical protein
MLLLALFLGAASVPKVSGLHHQHSQGGRSSLRHAPPAAIHHTHNKEQLLFTLNHGRVTLGSRSAKRRFMNESNSAAMELAKLAVEIKDLSKLITLLKKPGHYGDEQELKRLKRRKLLIKDKTSLLMQRTGGVVVGPEVQQSNGDNNVVDDDECIGAGGFADIVLGHQVLDDGLEHPVAIKLSRSAGDDAALLLQEGQFLRELDPYTGFVKVQHVETLVDTGNVALVLNLLGPSLEELWWAYTCGVGGFSAATVLQLAKDMVQRLDTLQKMGIVHRDIQPANILLGSDCHIDSTIIATTTSDDAVGADAVPHLIDFGIAKRINDDDAGRLQERDELTVSHAFSGTPQFASVHALRQHGGGNRACDDLESLCYTLAFLRSGTTPWEDDSFRNTHADALRLAERKAACCTPQELCGPNLMEDPAAIVIAELLAHARSHEKPDYAECQALIQNAQLK